MVSEVALTDYIDYWQTALRLKQFEDKETDTEWGYEKRNCVLIVGFQGSGSKLDWQQNFDFLKTPYRNMEQKFRVHRGFLKKWKAIQDDVVKLITDDIEFVIFVGYSRGGGIAVLAHEDIWYRFPHLRERLFSITYGAPRVVSWFAPKERFENVIRIQYGWDIVPGLPPWILGYKHIGAVQKYGPRFAFPLSPWDHAKYREEFSDV
jgi:triacylglycerol lipase